MYCKELTALIMSSHNVGYYTASGALTHGSVFSEPSCPERYPAHEWERDRMHEGKDASILHMLAGGNGWADNLLQTHMARAMFDVGVKRERDDMRALNFWQASLRNCLADRYRRFEV